MNLYWKLAILAAVAIGSWHISAKYHEAGWLAEKAAMVASSDSLYKGEAKRGSAAAETTEKKNAADKIVYRTITRDVDKIVDRPVYRNICLDADGLRAANAALTRAPADPGKPDPTMPASRSAYRWEWGLGVAQNR